MASKLSIRPYEPRDETALLDLVRELQVHEGHVYDRMKPADAIGPWYMDDLKQQCAEHDGTILVAEIDGRVVAYATIMTKVEADDIDELSFTYAYVGDLSVTQSRRGQGIGTAMPAEWARRAKAAGTRYLRITALAKNAQARATDQRFGFEELLVRHEKKL